MLEREALAVLVSTPEISYGRREMAIRAAGSAVKIHDEHTVNLLRTRYDTGIACLPLLQTAGKFILAPVIHLLNNDISPGIAVFCLQGKHHVTPGWFSECLR